MRKVIQASISRDDCDTNVVVAVCDDGTVWANCSTPNIWEQLPAIPQDEETT